MNIYYYCIAFLAIALLAIIAWHIHVVRWKNLKLLLNQIKPKRWVNKLLNINMRCI